MQYRIPALALVLGLAAAACSPDDPDHTPDTPAIELFEARPDALTPGQSTSLWWRTQLASTVRITDATGAEIDLEGKRPEADSVQVTPRGTTTYTLHAEGGGKTATATVEVQVEGTPTVEHFAAVPGKILPGEATTLTWRVQEADHVRILQGDEVLVDEEETFSGNLEVQPEQTTSYTLIATFGEAEATAETTVQVEPVIDVFTLSVEGPVAPGTEIELSWTTRGALALTLSNLETTVEIGGDEIAAGSATLAVGEAGTFRLVATSGDLEAAEERTLQVMPIPSIAIFEVPERAVASEDEPATITVRWDVQDATELRLVLREEEILDLVDAQGEVELTITETTPVRLEARNAVGEAEMTRTVQVVPPAKILAFAAEPEVVLAGELVTLSWEVEGAASVSLTRDGETIPVPAGVTSVEDRPEASATYELHAHDALGGAATASVEVLVVDALVTASLQATPAATAVGEDVTLRWTVSTPLPTWDVAVSLEDEAGTTYDLTGADPRAGSIVLPMVEMGQKVFTLTATSMGATATAQATVDVALAPTVILTSTPEALNPADLPAQVELAWETQDAASLEIFERKGDGALRSLLVVPASEVAAGAFSLEIDAPITFVAKAASAEGVERSETHVVAFGDPTIVSFVASATEVQRGASVTFTWETEHGVVSFGDHRSGTQEVQLPFLDVGALGGGQIGLKSCGGECEAVSLGFGFPFDGATHRTLWMDIHGFIAFEEPSAFGDDYFDGYCIGQSVFSAQELSIAPYWGEFSTTGGTSGLYAVETTDPMGRRFVALEWREVENYWDDGIATFQAVLWEDGTFDFRYGSMVGDDVNGDYGAIGYIHRSTYDAVNLTCEEMVPGGLSGKAYRFFGPPPATGSHTMTITASGPHELCVQGFGGQTECETITITVVD